MPRPQFSPQGLQVLEILREFIAEEHEERRQFIRFATRIIVGVVAATSVLLLVAFASSGDLGFRLGASLFSILIWTPGYFTIVTGFDRLLRVRMVRFQYQVSNELFKGAQRGDSR